jgi:ketosteroid isomerase-like protein
MRHAFWIGTLGLVMTAVAGVFPAAAQDDGEEGAETTAGGDEADHQALRDLKAVFEKAASENDLELLRPHVHENFSAVTFTNREFTDFDAFKDRWQKTRDEIVGDGSYKVTLLPERSRIDGDWAIARGDSENVLVNSAGKEYHFNSRWTAICRKVDGEWKLIRAHSSVDPFGNPMLLDGVKTRIIQFTAGAGIAGLVVGGLIAFLLARRRARPAGNS